MNQKKKQSKWPVLLLLGLILVVGAVIALTMLAGEDPVSMGRPGQTHPAAPGRNDPAADTTDTADTTDPSDTAPETVQGTAPTADAPIVTDPAVPDPEPTEPPEITPTTPVTPETPVELEQGLVVEMVGTYSGMYVEDGTGQIVSDIAMILLRNRSEQDLQLARIELEVQDRVYAFECTNLPAGEAAVLLEKNRSGAIQARPEEARITLVNFFDSPMELCSETIQLSGQKGLLSVTNVSEEDISGDVYVYYKFYEADCYYGGITFRVRARGGLKAGETQQLPAGHFNPESCRIVQVTHGA